MGYNKKNMQLYLIYIILGISSTCLGDELNRYFNPDACEKCENFVDVDSHLFTRLEEMNFDETYGAFRKICKDLLTSMEYSGRKHSENCFARLLNGNGLNNLRNDMTPNEICIRLNLCMRGLWG